MSTVVATAISPIFEPQKTEKCNKIVNFAPIAIILVSMSREYKRGLAQLKKSWERERFHNFFWANHSPFYFEMNYSSSGTILHFV